MLVVVGIFIAGLAAIPYFGTARLDAESREWQETLVRQYIKVWIGETESSLSAWTSWEEAIEKVEDAYDGEWTDRNIGRSIIMTSRSRLSLSLMVIIISSTQRLRMRSRGKRSSHVGIEDVAIWDVNPDASRRLAESLSETELRVSVVDDLPAAVRNADIVSAATLSTEVLICHMEAMIF